MELGVVVVVSCAVSTAGEGDTELAPEEVGTDTYGDKGNAKQTRQ